MSSIGGIGSYAATMHDPAQFHSMRRPDPEALASTAFAQIDTSSRGYIEKADLQSAMAQTGSTDGTTTSVEDLFTKLDGDGDGKVTKEEFTRVVTSLADELRQNGPMGASGLVPPGDGPDGAGFTKDELTTQLEDIGSSDDPRADLISTIVENFAAADTDGDGKVSFLEARTFAASQENGSSAAEASSSCSSASSGAGCSSSSTASGSLTASLAQQMMRLLQSYGTASASSVTSTSSLSLSA